jgi:hypothetical protein
MDIRVQKMGPRGHFTINGVLYNARLLEAGTETLAPTNHWLCGRADGTGPTLRTKSFMGAIDLAIIHEEVV